MNPFLPLKYKLQNFSTYFITWFFPKGRGKLFWKIYVYFRWVDDIVDDPKISQDYKRKFLKEQNEFLKNVYAEKKVKKMNYEEKGLYDIIKLYWNDSKAKELKKHIFNMMWTFEYDIDRIGKNIILDDFIKYSKIIGSAYAFSFIISFDLSYYEKKYNLRLKKHTSKDIFNLLSDYAHYSHIVHIIRDFKKDKEIGYVNFPKCFKSYTAFFRYLINYVQPKYDTLYDYYIIQLNIFKRIGNPLLTLIGMHFFNKFNSKLNKLALEYSLY